MASLYKTPFNLSEHIQAEKARNEARWQTRYFNSSVKELRLANESAWLKENCEKSFWRNKKLDIWEFEDDGDAIHFKMMIDKHGFIPTNREKHEWT